MPSKTEEYLALVQRTANGLTRYWESWTDYLTTASRLYKYPFADQLMIYAQRPDATACADFDIWNNRMNRYVRRGAKGIALLDESSGFPRLHYVFDVSDTGVRRNSRDPEVWQYNDDLKQPVSEMLAATYGISGERVSQQLADVAGKLVADYWDNNSEDISAIVDGSLLMDYDEAGVEMQFKSAAAISVTYTLLERCGFEPDGYFDKDSFQAIYDFSTPDTVYTLGAAVSDISREVLRTVERAVKTTIRRRNNERSQHEYEQQSELHANRGLSSPEPDSASAEEPAGQVRQDAPELSETAAPGSVPHDAPEREPVPDPDRTGADRSSDEEATDGRSAGEEPGPGQGEESDGVGTAHEQPTGAGRGSDSDGTDLQLSFLDAVIPTEAQQIEHIDRAESEKSPSAFVLSQAEIENELRKHGSGFQDGKQRIIELYQTQPDRKLRAKALAKEYGIGGHSQDFLDGSSGFVNHDGKGLEFDHYPDHQKVTLSWTQVEKYIDLMIQSDRYLTDQEKEHRAAVQEAERQLPMLEGDAAAEYNALKEQYPNTLIGFELGGYFLFYDKDPRQIQPLQEPPFQLLVDIQAKLAEGKSEGYAQWAKKYNLKEMSKTLIFLQEHKIGSADELNERTAAATEKYHQLGDSIKAAETRMAEIAVLKTHIVNYAKTHPVYDAYRKAGYSKKFLDTHREEITLHKVAKAAFDETGLKKLPKVKALNAEYSDLLAQKKAAYPDYRKAREEMQELVKAQKNIELFFAEEKDAQEKQQTR